jgi:peptidoglycan/LPS O-acetylase OafA/YrhL
VFRTERPEVRLVSIDVLRGVAVLLVLLVHLPFSWSAVPTRDQTTVADPALPFLLTAITNYGRFGVHLFLVISGFCIHLRWARWHDMARPLDFGAFWRRRLVRLYPPYAAALAASIVGLYLAYGVMLHGSGAEAFGYPSYGQLGFDVASLVLLLQNFTDAGYRIGNTPFWTLALEEQLYLLYFVLLVLRRRIGWGPTLAGIFAVTVAWRAIDLFVRGLPFDPLLIGPSRWIEWAFGALAVEAYLGRVTLPTWCYSRLVALGLLAAAVVLNLPGMDKEVPVTTLVADASFGAAFFVVVNLVTRADVRRAMTARWLVRPLGFVGLFSYSLYLTHLPVVVGTKQVLLRLGVTPGTWETVLVLVLRVVLALGAAYLFYRVIETRFIHLSRALGGRPEKPTRSPVGLGAVSR